MKTIIDYTRSKYAVTIEPKSLEASLAEFKSFAPNGAKVMRVEPFADEEGSVLYRVEFGDVQREVIPFAQERMSDEVFVPMTRVEIYAGAPTAGDSNASDVPVYAFAGKKEE